MTNGKLDLSESFMKSIGAYDVMTVRYAYTPFPAAQEKAGLDGVIKDMRDHRGWCSPARMIPATPGMTTARRRSPT